MTVDDIYTLVAENILNNIHSDNWEKAILNIHGDDHAMGIDGFYIENGNKTHLDVSKFDDEIEFALMELHEITTKGGENVWNSANFTLMSNGSFNLDLNWDSNLEN